MNVYTVLVIEEDWHNYTDYVGVYKSSDEAMLKIVETFEGKLKVTMLSKAEFKDFVVPTNETAYLIIEETL